MPEKTYKVPEIISIHALREEGDQRTRSIQTVRKEISIHALREEGDLYTVLDILRHKLDFYPRPPRGGRQNRRQRYNLYGQFLSTPSARRATAPSYLDLIVLYYFYPRPPRGGRPSEAEHCLAHAADFYPRPPRGGRLPALSRSCGDIRISIHALREEGDSKNREKTPCFCLIIHLSAQIAKRCLQTKPQNHTVTCANGWYSGAKRPGKPCVLPIRTGRTSKDQHAVLGKFWVQSNVLDLGLVVVA